MTYLFDQSNLIKTFAEIDKEHEGKDCSEECSTCKFWSPTRWTDIDELTGSCRRMPPILLSAVPIPKEDEDEDMEFSCQAFAYDSPSHRCTATKFPETKWDEWCGEFCKK